jgi:hypothetical protein
MVPELDLGGESYMHDQVFGWGMAVVWILWMAVPANVQFE